MTLSEASVQAPVAYSDALRDLADAYGITCSYFDIWGEQHWASDETLKAILKSFSVTDDAFTNASSLWQARQDAFKRPYLSLAAPVKVFRQSQGAPVLPVFAPEASKNSVLKAELQLEGQTEELQRIELSLASQTPTATHFDTYLEYALTLPEALPLGYHTLTLMLDNQQAQTRLIIAPDACYLPKPLISEALGDAKNSAWGISSQLYGLNSQKNWGIGDFGDLAQLMHWIGQKKGGFVGVNPLHALFQHNPSQASPYSPSSRLFLNPIYIDLESVEEFQDDDALRSEAQSSGFQFQLKALRYMPLVDYASVWPLKKTWLERLYARFVQSHYNPEQNIALTPRGEAFMAYLRNKGEKLEQYALYETLQEFQYQEDCSRWGWVCWPDAYKNPNSPQVQAFAQTHRNRCVFWMYTQWLAHRQLSHVRSIGQEHGMAVGLYGDIAVGADRGGSDVWNNQPLYLLNMSVGAPPDLLNMQGQNWGLPPMNPHVLREQAYQPFINMVQANMAYSGALRFDHVLGLYRMYWVPEYFSAADGAYVRYPFEDLLGILALESHRNQCMVIGEDLGTVPEEVQTAMASWGMLGYRVLYFEQNEDETFKAPSTYWPLTLATLGTHDLATLKGYWLGFDIDQRRELNLFPSEQAEQDQRFNRGKERYNLLKALNEQGLISESRLQAIERNEYWYDDELLVATYRYLMRTHSKLKCVQLEDVLGCLEPNNVPGTVTEHPNWRRKLPIMLEELDSDTRMGPLVDVLEAEGLL
ncbi:MAG: 4-alpha-glucanotransferase [Vampirovibrionales bacterium]|nr:4-alpha-glucanotransferase [Vampirovibrionales bacterium]